MRKLTVFVAVAMVAACSADVPLDPTTPLAPTVPAATTGVPNSTRTAPPPLPTTTLAASPMPTTSSTIPTLSTTPAGGVVLHGDGLGVVAFGDPAVPALATLERALGPPTELLRGSDEIARADSFHYGGPDATELLAIWRPIGLYVAFSEYPFYRTDGGLHFSGWAVTSADGPRSDGEVGVGSTVEEVHAAFGERFVTTDDVCGPPAFVTPPGEDTVAYRMVVVVDDEGEVVALFAGASPGC